MDKIDLTVKAVPNQNVPSINQLAEGIVCLSNLPEDKLRKLVRFLECYEQRIGGKGAYFIETEFPEFENTIECVPVDDVMGSSATSSNTLFYKSDEKEPFILNVIRNSVAHANIFFDSTKGIVTGYELYRKEDDEKTTVYKSYFNIEENVFWKIINVFVNKHLTK